MCRCIALKPIWGWVEIQEVTVTRGNQQAAMQNFMVEVDPVYLPAPIGGFLNTAVCHVAVDTFKLAEDLNGFAAWRLLGRHIDQGRALRLEKLRRQLQRRDETKQLQDIPLGISKFENLVQEFVDAGGERHSDATMKSDLLEMLPESLSDQLLWHATESSWSFAMFREHVGTTAARILHYKGNLPVHAVDDEKSAEEAKGLLERLEDILAMAQRCGPRHGGPGTKRDDMSPRCVNCEGTGRSKGKCPNRSCRGIRVHAMSVERVGRLPEAQCCWQARALSGGRGRSLVARHGRLVRT